MILASNKPGSYYITHDKTKNFSKLLSSFKNIVGVNLRKYVLGKNTAILLIGNTSNSKESWKLLASLMKGIGIKLDSKQTVSSFVIYNHEQLTEKDFTWIEDESKKISKLVKESKATKQSLTHTPRLSTTNKIAFVLIGIVILISAVEYPVLAVEYYHNAAHQSFVEGRFTEALTYNQKILEFDPNNREALQREKQIQFLSSTITDEKNRFKTTQQLNDLADKLTDTKSYYTANAFYYLAHLKDKSDTRALNGIGDALYNIGNREIEQVYNKKGFNLDEIARFDVAIQYHKDVLEIYEIEQDISNGYASALNGLGNIHTALRDFNSATKYHNIVIKTIELDNNQESDSLEAKKEAKTWISNAYLGLGRVHLNQLNYDKGIQFFKKANQVEINNTKTLNALGDTYFRKNDLTRAVDFYQQSLQINNKTNIDAFVGMGLVQHRSGNIEEGNKFLQQAQLINHKITDKLVDYADLLFENGDYNAAEYAYRAILFIDDNNDMALVGLGNKLLMIDVDVDEAIKVYDKALQININQAETILKQVEVLRSLGDKEGDDYNDVERLCQIIISNLNNNTDIISQLLEENCIQ